MVQKNLIYQTSPWQETSCKLSQMRYAFVSTFLPFLQLLAPEEQKMSKNFNLKADHEILVGYRKSATLNKYMGRNVGYDLSSYT